MLLYPRDHGARLVVVRPGPQAHRHMGSGPEIWIIYPYDMRELAASEASRSFSAVPDSLSTARPSWVCCVVAVWPRRRSGSGRRLTPRLALTGDGRSWSSRPEEVGAGFPVAENPPVTSGSVELAEVPVHNPAPRLVLVAMLGPLVGELPQVVVQPVKDVAGHHRPVIGRPSPDGNHSGLFVCDGVQNAG